MNKPPDKLTIEIGFHELVLLTRSLENTIKKLDEEINTMLDMPREMKNVILENIRQRNIAQVYKAAFTEKLEEAKQRNPDLDPSTGMENLYLLDGRHYFK